tara:strand:- start:201 stop:872 length:672 start_codon:yes stop_codon:yes gene_type:complete
MYISTEAIILKNINFKESSIISRIFTYEHGKISILIKGAKKSKNNILSIVESGNIVNCTFYNGKSSLKNIKEISCKKAHNQIRNNLLGYYFSMAIISILDKSIHENHQLKNLYNLSVHSLDCIDQKVGTPDIVFIHFLIHLVNHLGFHILDTFNIDDSNTKESIDMLNQCHDLNLVGPISPDIIDRIKIALYKHMRNHLIDLNEIQAIKMIKSIKHEESTRSN